MARARSKVKLERGVLEKGLSVATPICNNVSEPTVVRMGTQCGQPGCLEFGLAGLPGTGGGQEYGGVERGKCGQILDPSESQGDGTEDRVMAHTRGGPPRKKQPWGSHSRKKRAAPVEAWSVSTNLP